MRFRTLLFSMTILGFVLMSISVFYGLSVNVVKLPYQDGFESGDVSQWTSNYGKPRVVTSQRRCGNYALNCVVERGSEAVLVKFDAQSYVYGQAYISLNTLPNIAGERVILVRFSGDTWGPSISLQNVNGRAQWRLRYRDGDSWRQVYSVDGVPTENTYFRVQIYFEGGVEGKCFVWADDVQIFTIDSNIGLEPNTVNRLDVGVVYSNYAVDLLVDCVQIDTKYILPVDGGVKDSYNWIDRVKRYLHDIGLVVSVGSIGLWLLILDKRDKTLLFGVALLIVALLISFHHFVITEKFYDLNNVLLHEFFMALFGGIGIGVLIAEYLKTDHYDTDTMN